MAPVLGTEKAAESWEGQGVCVCVCLFVLFVLGASFNYFIFPLLT